jgi:hypothetical protein
MPKDVRQLAQGPVLLHPKPRAAFRRPFRYRQRPVLAGWSPSFDQLTSRKRRLKSCDCSSYRANRTAHLFPALRGNGRYTEPLSIFLHGFESCFAIYE